MQEEERTLQYRARREQEMKEKEEKQKEKEKEKQKVPASPVARSRCPPVPGIRHGSSRLSLSEQLEKLPPVTCLELMLVQKQWRSRIR